jgi:lysophospholipase L1-like esterase
MMHRPQPPLISKLRSPTNMLLLAGAIVCLMMAPASGALVRIMPLGDSITAGTTDPNWTAPFSFAYRGSLYTRLTNAGYAFQFVGASPEPWNGAPYGPPPTFVGPDLRALNQNGHRGYGGSTIGDITNGNGYDPGVVAALNADNPDIVLLGIGINDISYYGNGGNPTAAESSLSNLARMIVSTKPNAKLIIAQINSYKDGSLTNSVVAYNNYIKNTLVPGLAGQGYHVSTVDQFANFLKPNGSIDQSLYSNIIHPNPAGYDLMAATWFNGIRAITPEPSGLTLLVILGFALAARLGRHARRQRDGEP